ncbi:MAG: hypothetical protein WCL16_13050, partial [bacterium]
MKPHAHVRRLRKRDALLYVAMWQGLCFLMLVLLVWVGEFYDLSALWLHAPPRPPNLLHAWTLTIGISVTALITVGHTYEQQRHIIRGLLTICATCHRIRLSTEKWEQMDDYLGDHSLALLTHGLCPECFAAMQRDIETLDIRKKADTHKESEVSLATDTGLPDGSGDEKG